MSKTSDSHEDPYLGIGLTNGFSIVTPALVPSFILNSRVVYQNALAYLIRQTSHQIHLVQG